MDRVSVPRIPAEWAAIGPNEADEAIAAAWMDDPHTTPDYLAAASRIDEHERCVAALAFHLFDGSESLIVAQDEARRILGLEAPDAR